MISSPQWHMAQSALTFSCIYGGEEFDARKKQPGFSEGTYVEGMDWRPSVVTEAPKGRLTAQNIPPLAVMKRYAPVSWTCLGPGRWLADFGTNFSGWIRARIKTAHPAAGHTITFIPGEILDKDLQPDQSDTGKGYHWTYTMDETLYQEYHPRFTYTGFRYVLMEGAVPAHKAALSKQGKCNEALPILEEIWGEFIYPKDLEQGTFWCDHPLFNQIHKIICQAMLSNTKSIFTDCPHREKLGWMEQTHLIGPSIMYNYNVHNLYEKILQDMADSSKSENGLVPDICPQYIVFGYHEGFNDSPEWGSAVVLIHGICIATGMKEILRRMYPVMKGYIDYLTLKSIDDILHHGLGDWLDIGPMTRTPKILRCRSLPPIFITYDLTVMENVAGILGKGSGCITYASRRVDRSMSDTSVVF